MITHKQCKYPIGRGKERTGCKSILLGVGGTIYNKEKTRTQIV